MNVKGKRLLILGAGRGQIGLYKAARELGIHTIAGTLPDNNPPGIPLADEVCYMNIANPEDVLEKAETLQLDGVATCCLDTGIPALGRVCDTLSLTGLTEHAAILCGDKLKMKKAFMENHVSTARFYEVSSEQDLAQAVENLRFPVIIKATDLQGSNGIYIARTRNEAEEGYAAVMDKTRRDYCIVEEFIEGYEFGAQAFVYHGDIVFVMPHGDETFMSHTAVPVGHYIPFEAEETIISQTEETVKKAVRALGLNDCAVNVDLILREDQVYVIELTGRVGANCLPELVQINFGIEYYKMIAVMALGGNPLELWEKRRAENKAGLARMMLETENSGCLKTITYNGAVDDHVLEVSFFKHPGDEIRIFENSNDCIGQIIVQGDTLKECNDIMKNAVSKVEIQLK